MNTLEQIMETQGMPTLKAFAGVFNLNPVRLYSVAKQPKEGVVYDAKVFNWDAIERFITRRLDADKGLASLEDVVAKALEIDEELKKADGRRRALSGPNKIEVDGKMIPMRRYESFNMEAGQPVVLKKDPAIYAIVFQTASHTVLRAIKSKDLTDFASDEVKVISNGMLNMKGVAPTALETEIEARLTGDADTAATEA